jgi:Tfp pilus assembly protein PilX
MTRHRQFLADQRGFTMVSVMLSMMVVGLFAVGAWQAAVGDIPIARGDQDRKRAYEAAEAGLQWYGFQLQRDPTYWSKCTSVPAIAAGQPAPVNQEWKTGSTDPRQWRTLIASGEEYTIELLPATGQSSCNTANPSQSMIENGTMRIRATGRANGDKRSLVATYRRRSFVDFVWFTQWETLDPLAYSPTASFGPSQAAANCDDPRTVRDTASSNRCTEIQFITGDYIKGPLHTNDESFLTCGNPQFGRTGDRIEIAGPMPGNVEACTSNPNWAGTRLAPAPTLSMPPSNSQLSGLADAANGYRFTGNTCLRFNGTTVDYWSGAQATTPSWNSTSTTATPCTGPQTGTLAWPPPNGNKVIYVQNGAGCTSSYSYRQTYNNNVNCGDVMVWGTYGIDATIGAQNDIIVKDDLLKTGDSMLGLIANNFVRVYHPATMSSGNCSAGSGSNDPRMLGNVEIDAAILALNHSFIVDNWGCGSSQGNLKVVGAIAQYYRGPVGTSGGGTSGYYKDYNYDDRLRYKEPPNFLDPVQTQWNLMRRSEQQPAR